MYSTAILNAKETRKISCSAWNRRVIPLSSPGPAQRVSGEQHVARQIRPIPSTNDI
jgi:hypothetical protein